MKLRVFNLIVFAALSFFSFGQIQEEIDRLEANEDTIKIEVELITNLDSVEIPVYCGYAPYFLPLDFRIKKVISGTYDKPTIRINYMCPRRAIESKWIVNNGTYTYKVIEEYRLQKIDEKNYVVDKSNMYKIVW